MPISGQPLSSGKPFIYIVDRASGREAAGAINAHTVHSLSLLHLEGETTTMQCDAGIHCHSIVAFQSGALIAMVYVYLMFPGGTGDPPSASCVTWYPIFYKGMLILPISAERALHVHHWLVYCPIWIACFAVHYSMVGCTSSSSSTLSSSLSPSPPKEEHAAKHLVALMAVAGYALVMSIHGLVMYKDRFHFVTVNPYHVSKANEDTSFSQKRMAKCEEQKL